MMNELAITRVEHWAWRFTVMLTLSVVVAVMGLSADSAAVVIGAMLIAPLMTPVLATAASMSMSLIRKSMSSLLKVTLATWWCIGIAYLLSRALPDGPLPVEVLARTKPDIRDLVVALAAGAAGSYATVRKDASSALPGVAVAVALVPPLATVGITLEAGETDLAIGALLLYVTNLAAIIFAGVMVFIATGFVPPRRLSNTAVQLAVAAVIAFAVVVIIAVPLFNASADAVEAAEAEVEAGEIVGEWLNGVKLDYDVDVGLERVVVSLRGFEQPPDDAALEVALKQAFGDRNVIVEWVRVERATTTTTLPVILSDEEALLVDVRPVVDNWLVASDDGADYALENIEIVDGIVRIDVSGAGEPPSVVNLVDQLAASLGSELTVRLNWTPRKTITAEDELLTPIQETEDAMRPVVDGWAERTGLQVESFSYDGERVALDVIGADAPPIDRLISELQDVANANANATIDADPDAESEVELDVEVFFTERRRLTTTIFVIPESFGDFAPTAPGTTTTTTPGPTPTAEG